MNFFRLFILFLIFGFFTNISFACDFKPAVIPDVSSDAFKSELRSETTVAISECIEARAKNQEASVHNPQIWHICPSGEYWNDDQMIISTGTLAYNITAAIAFHKIDKFSGTYIDSLACSRNPDATAWINDIDTTISGVWEKEWYADIYAKICDITYMTSILTNTKFNEPFIQTTGTFPQIICQNQAKKKASALRNLGHILMGNWLAKWYQNDKDNYVDTIKGKYKQLLEKMHSYLMIFTRAETKLDKYTVSPVKR
jgi:hypothetical protein